MNIQFSLDDGISIDANRAHDDEPWRLERLDMLRRIMAYRHDLFVDQPAYVAALYDHKGALAVNWSATPSEEQQGAAREIWESVIFCEATIDHFVRGIQITDDCGWGGEGPFL